MFAWIILLVLLTMLIGAAPSWPHSRRWGYSPVAIIALLLVVFLCLWMFGLLPYWGHHTWWGGDQMNGAPMHQ